MARTGTPNTVMPPNPAAGQAQRLRKAHPLRHAPRGEGGVGERPVGVVAAGAAAAVAAAAAVPHPAVGEATEAAVHRVAAAVAVVAAAAMAAVAVAEAPAVVAAVVQEDGGIADGGAVIGAAATATAATATAAVGAGVTGAAAGATLLPEAAVTNQFMARAGTTIADGLAVAAAARLYDAPTAPHGQLKRHGPCSRRVDGMAAARTRQAGTVGGRNRGGSAWLLETKSGGGSTKHAARVAAGIVVRYVMPRNRGCGVVVL